MMNITFKEILDLQSKKPFAFYSIAYNGEGRILTIGDVHGCPKTLQKLIEQSDYLFLLGDLVNKDPNSIQVIDILLDLILDGYQVFPLKGNHEEMLLEDFEAENELIFYPDGEPILKEGNKYTSQIVLMLKETMFS